LILPPSANYRRGLFFGGESVAKHKSEQPVEQVETVAVLEETPAGVQLPRWRVRPKGSEAWQAVEAETAEDAVRAYNGRGLAGRVYAFKQLDVERV
jgi:hypothetical protein